MLRKVTSDVFLCVRQGGGVWCRSPLFCLGLVFIIPRIGLAWHDHRYNRIHCQNNAIYFGVRYCLHYRALWSYLFWEVFRFLAVRGWVLVTSCGLVHLPWRWWTFPYILLPMQTTGPFSWFCTEHRSVHLGVDQVFWCLGGIWWEIKKSANAATGVADGYKRGVGVDP